MVCLRQCSKSIATKSLDQDRTTTDCSHQDKQDKMTVLPYINGVSEKIGRTLKPYGIQIAHKPISKVSNLFPRHKAAKDVSSSTCVVYRVNCAECNFVYYGQTERSVHTRMQEHRRAICSNQKTSNIAQHANDTGHEFDFDAVKIVAKENNWHQRLFLEAWFSNLDKNSGNDHIQIPNIYCTLANSRTARANN